MSTFKQLEEYLRNTKGAFLPEIRYFDGLDSGENSRPFATHYGEFEAGTLEESVKLFLSSVNKTN